MDISRRSLLKGLAAAGVATTVGTSPDDAEARHRHSHQPQALRRRLEHALARRGDSPRPANQHMITADHPPLIPSSKILR